MVAGIDVQLVVSGCSYQFCWHADELEDEGLDLAALLQSEGFCVNPFHEELVEVADDRLFAEDALADAEEPGAEPSGASRGVSGGTSACRIFADRHG